MSEFFSVSSSAIGVIFGSAVYLAPWYLSRRTVASWIDSICDIVYIQRRDGLLNYISRPPSWFVPFLPLSHSLCTNYTFFCHVDS